MKKLIFLLLILCPLSFAFSVDLSCPTDVEAKSTVNCDLELKEAIDLLAFQFNFEVPDGFTLSEKKITSSLIKYDSLDRPAVVFSLSPIENGKLGTIHLISGSTSGEIKLVEKKPEFTSNVATVTVKGSTATTSDTKTAPAVTATSNSETADTVTATDNTEEKPKPIADLNSHLDEPVKEPAKTQDTKEEVKKNPVKESESKTLPKKEEKSVLGSFWSWLTSLF